MNASELFSNVMHFVSEAVVRIFAPNDDTCPVIGVQPFEGEPFKERKWAD